MDINILLALQNFRNGVGACLVSFMTKMSFIGEMNTVLIITALIYWCVSKDFGQYLLMGRSANRVVNGFLKVTACVYRPWIRDARIVPESGALAAATGYSFPSGHSTNAASLFGGGAIRKELPKALRIVLGVVLALIPYSRCFFGRAYPSGCFGRHGGRAACDVADRQTDRMDRNTSGKRYNGDVRRHFNFCCCGDICRC